MFLLLHVDISGKKQSKHLISERNLADSSSMEHVS